MPADLDRVLRQLMARTPSSPHARPSDAPAPQGVDGWFDVVGICASASVQLQREVEVHHLHALLASPVQRVVRFEIVETRIRALYRPAGLPTPDLLFHATTDLHLAAAAAAGALTGGRRKLLLSADESQAWRAAHRLAAMQARLHPERPPPSPRVLAVDALRARRAGIGVSAWRADPDSTTPLWATARLPLRFLLDFQPGYDVQVSAGAIPARRTADGRYQVALVRVGRRSGSTWEVAKGKLDPGETPEAAALRELGEEIGSSTEFQLLREIGLVRYGFMAPGGQPRLKTVHLFLVTPASGDGELGALKPAEAEGIHEVAWFDVDDAVDAVRHPSLLPRMHDARRLLMEHGLEPDPRYVAHSAYGPASQGRG